MRQLGRLAALMGLVAASEPSLEDTFPALGRHSPARSPGGGIARDVRNDKLDGNDKRMRQYAKRFASVGSMKQGKKANSLKPRGGKKR